MDRANDNNRPWMRQKAVAEHLGVSISFLEKLRQRGDGPPYHKLGRAVVYNPAELDAWAAGRRRLSTSDPGAAA